MIRPARRVREFFSSGLRYPYSLAYGEEAERYINLSSNESPYGPSPLVVRIVRKELAKLSCYPDPACADLRNEISKFLGVPRESVIVGNGSDEIMDLVCKVFLDEGDEVFIPLPSFSVYDLTSRIYGGRPRFYKLPNFEWREEIVEKAKGCKLAFLGRPNNPTGNAPPKSLLAELAGEVGVLVVDEAYIEFSDEESLARWASKQPNVIVLRTFSKAFGLAGLRIGYGVGNPRLVRLLDAVRLPFNVNRVAQAAATAALRDTEYLRGVVVRIKRERERIFRKLMELGLRPMPSQANFLMVNVKPWGVSAGDFCGALLKKGILVRSLQSFRGAGKFFVRITVGTPAQNERLLAALEEIREEIL